MKTMEECLFYVNQPFLLERNTFIGHLHIEAYAIALISSTKKAWHEKPSLKLYHNI